MKTFNQYDCLSGIQLAHAGRKASFLRPWDGASPITENDKIEPAWQTIGPSAIPINNSSPVPKEMTIEDINRVKEDFKNAAIRANIAGFDIIEIHGAHGYLLHSFFSPIFKFINFNFLCSDSHIEEEENLKPRLVPFGVGTGLLVMI